MSNKLANVICCRTIAANARSLPSAACGATTCQLHCTIKA